MYFKYLILAHRDRNELERFLTNTFDIKEDTYKSLCNLHYDQNTYWSIAFNVTNDEYGSILTKKIPYPEIILLIYHMDELRSFILSEPMLQCAFNRNK